MNKAIGFSAASAILDDRPEAAFFRPLTIAAVALWGAASALAAMNGLYAAADGRPPFGVLAAAATPPLVFLAAYGRSARLRGWVAALDPGFLAAMQGWRVVGAAFLSVWGVGELPALFAAPAGLGDVAVGLAAPFVALAAWRRTAGWRAASYGLIAAGMLDFAVAFSTGVALRDGGLLHAPGAVSTHLLGAFPLALIPTYAVPIFIILHLTAWLNLRHGPARARRGHFTGKSK